MKNVLVHPIFIGGMFKSGTSLLRAMLGKHSDLVSGLETHWFEIDWQNRDREPTSNRLQTLRSFYDMNKSVFEQNISKSRSAEDFLNNFFNTLVEDEQKKSWVEKTPGNILHVERIIRAWPKAHFVHIIRDPRDILSSLIEANKWGDIDQFLERWCPVFESVKSLKSGELRCSKNYIEIRYEDLVLSPNETLKTVCEFADIEYQNQMAKFTGESADFEKVKNITGKKSTTLERLSKPLQFSRIGIWKQVLNSNQIDTLECKVKERDLFEMYKNACYFQK